MKFTLSWLNEFISTEGHTPAQLADRLTMLGLEVDSVEDLSAGLEAITVAKVVEVTRHPDADKLTVCTVDSGRESLQVVCGAPNVRPGMIAALASPGVRLPDGTKIKKSKVRGVVSAGMLCSSRELGLADDHSGIMDLAPDLVAGQPLIDALGLRDTVIEVDLTPNRPDCACVRGIAREVGSFCKGPLRPLVDRVTPLTGAGVDYSVVIEAPDLCPRYTARKLRGVRLGPSPQWMQQRLAAVGMRPINNIVDITNYVMLESGQPLHAFDFDTLGGKRIIVRRPAPGETILTTLDGSQRQLDGDTLLICDGERPVALAGVMGGLDTEITDATTTILLESACFNPISIRRTARRLGIPSEASYRFERGVDPNLADIALERAVNLMVELAGAVADADGVDVYPGRTEPLGLQLRVSRVRSLLGVSVGAEEVARLLRSIGFEIETRDADTLQVVVPSFRVDIEREVDLVEEVARLIGYNEIPSSQPVIRMDYPKRDGLRSLRQEIAGVMTAQGFYEAINYSFVSEMHLDLCRIPEGDSRRLTTRLLNPLADDQGIMRTLLLPGLLENIRRNINFQRSHIRLFEIGKVFCQKVSGRLPEERQHLCAVISGFRYPQAEPLHFAGQDADFLDIKGVLANLLQVLRIDETASGLAFVADPLLAQPYCEPACSLTIRRGDEVVGSLGAILPETLKGFGIKQRVFYLDIDLQLLLTLPRKEKQFTALPRYPSVRRDMSLVVPENFPAGDLLRSVYGQKQKYVESAEIFDVYRGKPIREGMKSVSLSVTYRSAETTLDDQSVDKVHDKIVTALMDEFNARYREGSEI